MPNEDLKQDTHDHSQGKHAHGHDTHDHDDEGCACCSGDAAPQTIVKICGFQRAEDVEMAINKGADIVGFVVNYPTPVPWNQEPEEAAHIIKQIPAEIGTCVVTGGSIKDAFAIAGQLRPDYLQYHWESTVEDTTQLITDLQEIGVQLIQVIFPHQDNIEGLAHAYYKAGVCALLLDPRAPDTATEGGPVDFALYKRVQSAADCPVIVAGSITPENVAEIVQGTGAPIIDLMSGIETEPGIKDKNEVENLFKALAL